MITPLAVALGFLIICFIFLAGMAIAGIGAAYEKMIVLIIGGVLCGAAFFSGLAGCVYLIASFIAALAA